MLHPLKEDQKQYRKACFLWNHQADSDFVHVEIPLTQTITRSFSSPIPKAVRWKFFDQALKEGGVEAIPNKDMPRLKLPILLCPFVLYNPTQNKYHIPLWIKASIDREGNLQSRAMDTGFLNPNMLDPYAQILSFGHIQDFRQNPLPALAGGLSIDGIRAWLDQVFARCFQMGFDDFCAHSSIHLTQDWTIDFGFIRLDSLRHKIDHSAPYDFVDRAYMAVQFMDSSPVSSKTIKNKTPKSSHKSSVMPSLSSRLYLHPHQEKIILDLQNDRPLCSIDGIDQPAITKAALYTGLSRWVSAAIEGLDVPLCFYAHEDSLSAQVQGDFMEDTNPHITQFTDQWRPFLKSFLNTEKPRSYHLDIQADLNISTQVGTDFATLKHAISTHAILQAAQESIYLLTGKAVVDFEGCIEIMHVFLQDIFALSVRIETVHKILLKLQDLAVKSQESDIPFLLYRESIKIAKRSVSLEQRLSKAEAELQKWQDIEKRFVILKPNLLRQKSSKKTKPSDSVAAISQISLALQQEKIPAFTESQRQKFYHIDSYLEAVAQYIATQRKKGYKDVTHLQQEKGNLEKLVQYWAQYGSMFYKAKQDLQDILAILHHGRDLSSITMQRDAILSHDLSLIQEITPNIRYLMTMLAARYWELRYAQNTEKNTEIQEFDQKLQSFAMLYPFFTGDCKSLAQIMVYQKRHDLKPLNSCPLSLVVDQSYATHDMAIKPLSALASQAILLYPSAPLNIQIHQTRHHDNEIIQLYESAVQSSEKKSKISVLKTPTDLSSTSSHPTINIPAIAFAHIAKDAQNYEIRLCGAALDFVRRYQPALSHSTGKIRDHIAIIAPDLRLCHLLTQMAQNLKIADDSMPEILPIAAARPATHCVVLYLSNDFNIDMEKSVIAAQKHFIVFGDIPNMFAPQQSAIARHFATQYWPDKSRFIQNYAFNSHIRFTVLEQECDRIRSLSAHQDIFLEAIQKSQRRLLIASPYLSHDAVTHRNLVPLLVQAQKRGVEIRIFYDFMANTHPELKDHYPHAKSVISQFYRSNLPLVGVNQLDYAMLAYDDALYIDGAFHYLADYYDDHTHIINQEGSMMVRGQSAAPIISNLWKKSEDWMEKNIPHGLRDVFDILRKTG